ncbi:MAG TPA: hemin uptake protein HemP [Burkholderiaceae bacterium]|jgi:hemin uptake protein HemP
MKSTPHPHVGQPPPALVTSPVGASTPRRRLTSHALLGNDREIEIDHAGQLYRLRLTSLGKLILTK